MFINNKKKTQNRNESYFNNFQRNFVQYKGPDRRLRTLLKKFLMNVSYKIFLKFKKILYGLINLIQKIKNFLLYKVFWFLIEPFYFVKRYLIDPTRIIIIVILKVPFEIIGSIFSFKILDSFKEIYDIAMVHFWFSPIKYMGNKSTAVCFYKLALGIYLFGEEYQLPEMPITFREKIQAIVHEDIRQRESQAYQTADYYKPSNLDTEGFKKLEPLLASRHRLDEELEEARAEGTFYDYYLVVEDLRKLGFEEKLLEQVDFLMLLYFNDELLQYARRHLNLTTIDGDHLITKEDLLEQLRLHPELLEWGKGLLRNKVNIYIHMEREQRERREEKRRLKAHREEVVKRTNPLIGKLYLILIAMLDNLGRKEENDVLSDEQFEEEQDRDDGIEEVVNYDFWTFIETNSYQNFIHRLRMFKGSYYIRRFKQITYLLGLLSIFIAFFITFACVARVCVELYIEFEYYWGDFFAECRLDPESWGYVFGRLSFYVEKVRLSFIEMIYSFIQQMGHEIIPVDDNTDLNYTRVMSRSYLKGDYELWNFEVDDYCFENKLYFTPFVYKFRLDYNDFFIENYYGHLWYWDHPRYRRFLELDVYDYEQSIIKSIKNRIEIREAIIEAKEEVEEMFREELKDHISDSFFDRAVEYEELYASVHKKIRKPKTIYIGRFY